MAVVLLIQPRHETIVKTAMTLDVPVDWTVLEWDAAGWLMVGHRREGGSQMHWLAESKRYDVYIIVSLAERTGPLDDHLDAMGQTVGLPARLGATFDTWGAFQGHGRAAGAQQPPMPGMPAMPELRIFAADLDDGRTLSITEYADDGLAEQYERELQIIRDGLTIGEPLSRLHAALVATRDGGDAAAQLASLERIIEHCEQSRQYETEHFKLLARDPARCVEAYEIAAGFLDLRQRRSQGMLNDVAWYIATEADLPERNLDIALELALRASSMSSGNDGGVYDTVARVYYEMGDLENAIEQQKIAVRYAPVHLRAVIQEALEKYERELDGVR